MNRRSFLQLSALVAASSALAGCQPAYRVIGGPVEPVSGDDVLLRWADYAGLRRLTFGPRRVEKLRVAEIGLAGWIEEQLAPHAIDDGPLDWRLRAFDTLRMTADDLYTHGSRLLGSFDSGPILDDLRAATLLRQVYSRRQLYELMVDFWTDHFNISVDKEDVWYLKTVDDREVIRPHALGNFRDLLQASAHSPAMLTYLDNQANLAGAPNENYARELLELHSLGVDGGYTQRDVMELARCLTGWTVKTRFWRGEFSFNPDLHDPGPKTVLGQNIPPGGIAEAEAVIDRLATHPATARLLAHKLARRLIADHPPAGLVERAAAAFLSSGGEIKALLRVLLFDGLLALGPDLPPKYRRPVDFVAAALRGLDAETDGRGGDDGVFTRILAQLGQAPYQWPTPDGPPDTAEDWIGSLLPRWNFAGRLARGEIAGTRIDFDRLIPLEGAQTLDSFIEMTAFGLLGAPLPGGGAAALAADLRSAGAHDGPKSFAIVLAGVLSSPAYQWR